MNGPDNDEPSGDVGQAHAPLVPAEPQPPAAGVEIPPQDRRLGHMTFTTAELAELRKLRITGHYADGTPIEQVSFPRRQWGSRITAGQMGALAEAARRAASDPNQSASPENTRKKLLISLARRLEKEQHNTAGAQGEFTPRADPYLDDSEWREAVGVLAYQADCIIRCFDDVRWKHREVPPEVSLLRSAIEGAVAAAEHPAQTEETKQYILQARYPASQLESTLGDDKVWLRRFLAYIQKEFLPRHEATHNQHTPDTERRRPGGEEPGGPPAAAEGVEHQEGDALDQRPAEAPGNAAGQAAQQPVPGRPSTDDGPETTSAGTPAAGSGAFDSRPALKGRRRALIAAGRDLTQCPDFQRRAARPGPEEELADALKGFARASITKPLDFHAAVLRIADTVEGVRAAGEGQVTDAQSLDALVELAKHIAAFAGSWRATTASSTAWARLFPDSPRPKPRAQPSADHPRREPGENPAGTAAATDPGGTPIDGVEGYRLVPGAARDTWTIVTTPSGGEVTRIRRISGWWSVLQDDRWLTLPNPGNLQEAAADALWLSPQFTQGIRARLATALESELTSSPIPGARYEAALHDLAARVWTFSYRRQPEVAALFGALDSYEPARGAAGGRHAAEQLEAVRACATALRDVREPEAAGWLWALTTLLINQTSAVLDTPAAPDGHRVPVHGHEGFWLEPVTLNAGQGWRLSGPIDIPANLWTLWGEPFRWRVGEWKRLPSSWGLQQAAADAIGLLIASAAPESDPPPFLTRDALKAASPALDRYALTLAEARNDVPLPDDTVETQLGELLALLRQPTSAATSEGLRQRAEHYTQVREAARTLRDQRHKLGSDEAAGALQPSLSLLIADLETVTPRLLATADLLQDATRHGTMATLTRALDRAETDTEPRNGHVPVRLNGIQVGTIERTDDGWLLHPAAGGIRDGAYEAPYRTAEGAASAVVLHYDAHGGLAAQPPAPAHQADSAPGDRADVAPGGSLPHAEEPLARMPGITTAEQYWAVRTWVSQDTSLRERIPAASAASLAEFVQIMRDPRRLRRWRDRVTRSRTGTLLFKPHLPAEVRALARIDPAPNGILISKDGSRHEPDQQAVIPWEELPAWIGLGLNGKRRGELLAAHAAVDRLALSKGTPAWDEATDRLEAAAAAVWRAIDEAGHPSHKALAAAWTHHQPGPVIQQDALFDLIPPQGSGPYTSLGEWGSGVRAVIIASCHAFADPQWPASCEGMLPVLEATAAFRAASLTDPARSAITALTLARAMDQPDLLTRMPLGPRARLEAFASTVRHHAQRVIATAWGATWREVFPTSEAIWQQEPFLLAQLGYRQENAAHRLPAVPYKPLGTYESEHYREVDHPTAPGRACYQVPGAEGFLLAEHPEAWNGPCFALLAPDRTVIAVMIKDHSAGWHCALGDQLPQQTDEPVLVLPRQPTAFNNLHRAVMNTLRVWAAETGYDLPGPTAYPDAETASHRVAELEPLTIRLREAAQTIWPLSAPHQPLVARLLHGLEQLDAFDRIHMDGAQMRHKADRLEQLAPDARALRDHLEHTGHQAAPLNGLTALLGGYIHDMPARLRATADADDAGILPPSSPSRDRSTEEDASSAAGTPDTPELGTATANTQPIPDRSQPEGAAPAADTPAPEAESTATPRGPAQLQPSGATAVDSATAPHEDAETHSAPAAPQDIPDGSHALDGLPGYWWRFTDGRDDRITVGYGAAAIGRGSAPGSYDDADLWSMSIGGRSMRGGQDASRTAQLIAERHRAEQDAAHATGPRPAETLWVHHNPADGQDTTVHGVTEDDRNATAALAAADFITSPEGYVLKTSADPRVRAAKTGEFVSSMLALGRSIAVHATAHGAPADTTLPEVSTAQRAELATLRSERRDWSPIEFQAGDHVLIDGPHTWWHTITAVHPDRLALEPGEAAYGEVIARRRGTDLILRSDPVPDPTTARPGTRPLFNADSDALDEEERRLTLPLAEEAHRSFVQGRRKAVAEERSRAAHAKATAEEHRRERQRLLQEPKALKAAGGKLLANERGEQLGAVVKRDKIAGGTLKLAKYLIIDLDGHFQTFADRLKDAPGVACQVEDQLSRSAPTGWRRIAWAQARTGAVVRLPQTGEPELNSGTWTAPFTLTEYAWNTDGTLTVTGTRNGSAFTSTLDSRLARPGLCEEAVGDRAIQPETIAARAARPALTTALRHVRFSPLSPDERTDLEDAIASVREAEEAIAARPATIPQLRERIAAALQSATQLAQLAEAGAQQAGDEADPSGPTASGTQTEADRLREIATRARAAADAAAHWGERFDDIEAAAAHPNTQQDPAAAAPEADATARTHSLPLDAAAPQGTTDAHTGPSPVDELAPVPDSGNPQDPAAPDTDRFQVRTIRVNHKHAYHDITSVRGVHGEDAQAHTVLTDHGFRKVKNTGGQEWELDYRWGERTRQERAVKAAHALSRLGRHVTYTSDDNVRHRPETRDLDATPDGPFADRATHLRSEQQLLRGLHQWLIHGSVSDLQERLLHHILRATIITAVKAQAARWSTPDQAPPPFDDDQRYQPVLDQAHQLQRHYQQYGTAPETSRQLERLIEAITRHLQQCHVTSTSEHLAAWMDTPHPRPAIPVHAINPRGIYGGISWPRPGDDLLPTLSFDVHVSRCVIRPLDDGRLRVTTPDGPRYLQRLTEQQLAAWRSNVRDALREAPPGEVLTETTYRRMVSEVEDTLREWTGSATYAARMEREQDDWDAAYAVREVEKALQTALGAIRNAHGTRTTAIVRLNEAAARAEHTEYALTWDYAAEGDHDILRRSALAAARLAASLETTKDHLLAHKARQRLQEDPTGPRFTTTTEVKNHWTTSPDHTGPSSRHDAPTAPTDIADAQPLHLTPHGHLTVARHRDRLGVFHTATALPVPALHAASPDDAIALADAAENLIVSGAPFDWSSTALPDRLATAEVKDALKTAATAGRRQHTATHNATATPGSRILDSAALRRLWATGRRTTAFDRQIGDLHDLNENHAQRAATDTSLRISRTGDFAVYRDPRWTVVTAGTGWRLNPRDTFATEEQALDFADHLATLQHADGRRVDWSAPDLAAHMAAFRSHHGEDLHEAINRIYTDFTTPADPAHQEPPATTPMPTTAPHSRPAAAGTVAASPEAGAGSGSPHTPAREDGTAPGQAAAPGETTSTQEDVQATAAEPCAAADLTPGTHVAIDTIRSGMRLRLVGEVVRASRISRPSRRGPVAGYEVQLDTPLGEWRTGADIFVPDGERVQPLPEDSSERYDFSGWKQLHDSTRPRLPERTAVPEGWTRISPEDEVYPGDHVRIKRVGKRAPRGTYRSVDIQYPPGPDGYLTGSDGSYFKRDHIVALLPEPAETDTSAPPAPPGSRTPTKLPEPGTAEPQDSTSRTAPQPPQADEDGSVPATVDYDIPAFLLEEAKRRVATANRRAERAGIQARFTITVRTYEKPYEEDDGTQRFEERAVLTLNRPTLELSGYRFIATLTWDPEAGLVTRTMPGQTLSRRPRACECDVCHTKRDRKDTYLVRGPDGTETQVGSNCLDQFLGIRPAGLWTLEWNDLKDLTEPDEERDLLAAGPGHADRFSTLHILALTAAVTAEDGWISKEAAEFTSKTSTSSCVQTILFPPRQPSPELSAWLRDMRSRAQGMTAQAEELREAATGVTGDGEWATNLRAVAGAASVSVRNIGLLVSAAAVKQQNDRRKVAEKLAENSQWVGEADGKLQDLTDDEQGMAAEILDVYVNTEGDWGTSTLVKFVTLDGHVLLWWATGYRTSDFVTGDEVWVRGTIKKHTDYKGRKETQVTRCKVTPRAGRALERAQAAAASLHEVPEGFACTPAGPQRDLELGELVRIDDWRSPFGRDRYATVTITNFSDERGDIRYTGETDDGRSVDFRPRHIVAMPVHTAPPNPLHREAEDTDPIDVWRRVREGAFGRTFQLHTQPYEIVEDEEQARQLLHELAKLHADAYLPAPLDQYRKRRRRKADTQPATTAPVPEEFQPTGTQRLEDLKPGTAILTDGLPTRVEAIEFHEYQSKSLLSRPHATVTLRGGNPLNFFGEGPHQVNLTDAADQPVLDENDQHIGVLIRRSEANAGDHLEVHVPRNALRARNAVAGPLPPSLRIRGYMAPDPMPNAISLVEADVYAQDGTLLRSGLDIPRLPDQRMICRLGTPASQAYRTEKIQVADLKPGDLVMSPSWPYEARLGRDDHYLRGAEVGPDPQEPQSPDARLLLHIEGRTPVRPSWPADSTVTAIPAERRATPPPVDAKVRAQQAETAPSPRPAPERTPPAPKRHTSDAVPPAPPREASTATPSPAPSQQPPAPRRATPKIATTQEKQHDLETTGTTAAQHQPYKIKRVATSKGRRWAVVDGIQHTMVWIHHDGGAIECLYTTKKAAKRTRDALLKTPALRAEPPGPDSSDGTRPHEPRTSDTAGPSFARVPGTVIHKEDRADATVIKIRLTGDIPDGGSAVLTCWDPLGGSHVEVEQAVYVSGKIGETSPFNGRVETSVEGATVEPQAMASDRENCFVAAPDGWARYDQATAPAIAAGAKIRVRDPHHPSLVRERATGKDPVQDEAYSTVTVETHDGATYSGRTLDRRLLTFTSAQVVAVPRSSAQQQPQPHHSRLARQVTAPEQSDVPPASLTELRGLSYTDRAARADRWRAADFQPHEDGTRVEVFLIDAHEWTAVAHAEGHTLRTEKGRTRGLEEVLARRDATGRVITLLDLEASPATTEPAAATGPQQQDRPRPPLAHQPLRHLLPEELQARAAALNQWLEGHSGDDTGDSARAVQQLNAIYEELENRQGQQADAEHLGGREAFNRDLETLTLHDPGPDSHQAVIRNGNRLGTIVAALDGYTYAPEGASAPGDVPSFHSPEGAAVALARAIPDPEQGPRDPAPPPRFVLTKDEADVRATHGPSHKLKVHLSRVRPDPHDPDQRRQRILKELCHRHGRTRAATHLSNGGRLAIITLIPGKKYAVRTPDRLLSTGRWGENLSRADANKIADALESIRDADGNPFQWDMPDYRTRADRFRDAHGRGLTEAILHALVTHHLDPAGKYTRAYERRTGQRLTPDGQTKPPEISPTTDPAPSTQHASQQEDKVPSRDAFKIWAFKNLDRLAASDGTFWWLGEYNNPHRKGLRTAPELRDTPILVRTRLSEDGGGKGWINVLDAATGEDVKNIRTTSLFYAAPITAAASGGHGRFTSLPEVVAHLRTAAIAGLPAHRLKEIRRIAQAQELVAVSDDGQFAVRNTGHRFELLPAGSGLPFDGIFDAKQYFTGTGTSPEPLAHLPSPEEALDFAGRLSDLRHSDGTSIDWSDPELPSQLSTDDHAHLNHAVLRIRAQFDRTHGRPDSECSKLWHFYEDLPGREEKPGDGQRWADDISERHWLLLNINGEYKPREILHRSETEFGTVLLDLDGAGAWHFPRNLPLEHSDEDTLLDPDGSPVGWLTTPDFVQNDDIIEFDIDPDHTPYPPTATEGETAPGMTRVRGRVMFTRHHGGGERTYLLDATVVNGTDIQPAPHKIAGTAFVLPPRVARMSNRAPLSPQPFIPNAPKPIATEAEHASPDLPPVPDEEETEAVTGRPSLRHEMLQLLDSPNPPAEPIEFTSVWGTPLYVAVDRTREGGEIQFGFDSDAASACLPRKRLEKASDEAVLRAVVAYMPPSLEGFLHMLDAGNAPTPRKPARLGNVDGRPLYVAVDSHPERGKIIEFSFDSSRALACFTPRSLQAATPQKLSRALERYGEAYEETLATARAHHMRSQIRATAQSRRNTPDEHSHPHQPDQAVDQQLAQKRPTPTHHR